MPVQSQVPDQDEQEQLSIIEAFLNTVHHFFGDFAELFGTVQDPRVPDLITYPLAVCRRKLSIQAKP